MKRILSTILILAMMLSVMPVISFADAADDAPYADAVGEIPTNLIKEPENASLWHSNPTYTNSTTYQTREEWKGSSYAGYGFKTTGTVTSVTNGYQVAAGSRLVKNQFNDNTFLEGEHYVIKFAARSLTPDTGFGVRVGIWNGAYSGRATDVSQLMGYEGGIAQVPADGSWQIIQGTFPALTAADVANGRFPTIIVGMAAGTPADVIVEFNSHYAAIPEGVPYFAKETPVEVNLESDLAIAEPGDKVTLTTEVLNQLGLQGALDQEAINWYVTNEERTEKIATGFEFNGSELTIASNAVPGTYAIVAESSVNPAVRKGVALTVLAPVKNDYVPGEVVEGEAYNITLTRTSEEREYYTALNELTLSAALVDDNGSADGIEQNISWIVLEEEKRNELAEGITVVSDSDNNAVVTFDPAIPEGTYYVRAYKTGDIMFGKNFKVVIDNDQILKDIIKELNEDESGKLKENLPKYLPYIDAQNTLYEKTDKDALDSVIKAMVEAGEEFTDENLADNFKTACVLSLYNVPSEEVTLNNEDGSFVYAKELGLDTVDAEGATLYSEVYANEITSAGKSKVISALSNVKTKADAISTFSEKTLLSAIYYTESLGTNYVTELLTKENLKAAGIEAKGYLSSDAKEMYEDEIAHKELTKKELEEILKKEYSADDEEEDDDDDYSAPSRRPSVSGPSISVPVETKKEEENTETKDINFADVSEDHWAFVNIQFLAKLDVLKGDENGNFNPEKAVTREEFVKILVEAFDLAGGAQVNFADVVANSWYADYVSVAVANGVITGKEDGTFGVGEAVSREDMCVMIARVLGMGQDAEGSLTYADSEEIAPYAQNSVGYLSMLSMINGMPDNTFRPKDVCTRSQAARVIADILNYNVMEVNG